MRSKKKTTKKKATKKRAVKKTPRRKQCRVKGCRKGHADGSEECTDHTSAAEPLTAVNRLSDMDRLRFVETDTLCINNEQATKILEQERSITGAAYAARKAGRIEAQNKDDRDHLVETSGRERQIKSLKAEAETLKLEAARTLTDLGSSYGFDPSNTSIDDKTGVIHEGLAAQ